jgi:hypothetical protein
MDVASKEATVPEDFKVCNVLACCIKKRSSYQRQCVARLITYSLQREFSLLVLSTETSNAVVMEGHVCTDQHVE